jgi:hypothetical protein
MQIVFQLFAEKIFMGYTKEWQSILMVKTYEKFFREI